MADQVKYTRKLQGASVLVIGGTSGIGYGVAEACVEYGASVFISSSSQSRVDDKVAQLKSLYPSAKSRIAGHVCDLGNAETLETNIKKLLDTVGKVDHIVHTAGDALAVRKITEIDIPMIIQASTVRFYAPLIIGKYASQYLKGGPESSIVLTTGAVSERPIPDWSVIGSIMTGLQGMVRGLALDLKPIRVNLVSPGAVDTELWKMSDDEKAKFFKGVEDKVPTGRVGKVEDVAQSYIYLMMDHNITGAMISTSSGNLLV